MGALVARRRVRLRPRGDRAARRARPRWRGARLGGRGRRGPAADERGARRGGRRRRETAPGARRPGGRPGRDPPADARRDRGRGAGARPAAGDLHADLQRLRRAGGGDPPRRLRGVDAHHRGRLPPPRVVGAAEGRGRRGGRGGAVRPSRAGRAARGRCHRDAVDARPRCLVARPGRRRVGRADRRRGGSRDALHADLHLGHDRPAEGRRPRPRRLPDQGRPGPRPPVRPRARRHAVLVHGPRLDDGAVGDLGVAAARRAARALRGRARLPGPGPAVVAGRAAPRHPPGPLADGHPGADGARRGAGPRARPVLAAGPRLDRGAVEPGPVVVVLPRGRRGPLPDRQLLGRDRGLRRDRVGQPARADQAGVVLRAVHRDRGGRRGRDRRVGPRRGRRARDPRADARHDPRVLARPRALRGDVLVAHPGHLGPRRLGEHRGGRLLVHPRPLRRHAQGRRQARRAGGGRERGRVAPGRPGGGRDRRAARDQGRGGRRPLRAPPGRDGRRRTCAPRSRGPSRTSSASRSSRRSSRSSGRCPRPGPAR